MRINVRLNEFNLVEAFAVFKEFEGLYVLLRDNDREDFFKNPGIYTVVDNILVVDSSAELKFLKEQKRLVFKNNRDSENSAPILYRDVYIDADDISKGNISRVLNSFNSDIIDRVDWVTSDNTTISLDKTEFTDMYNSIQIREQLLFSKFSIKLNDIISSNNKEQLYAITW
ncbi:MAG: DUF4376 domain-containing protein [Paraclostridium sp.]